MCKKEKVKTGCKVVSTFALLLDKPVIRCLVGRSYSFECTLLPEGYLGSCKYCEITVTLCTKKVFL